MHEILLEKYTQCRVCFFPFIFCVRFASFIDCLQITLRIQIWSLFIRFVILFFRFTHIHFAWRYSLQSAASWFQRRLCRITLFTHKNHDRNCETSLISYQTFFSIFFNEQLQIYLVDFFHLYSPLFWWTASCFCVYKFIQWNKNITHIFMARTNDCCSIYNLIPIVSDGLIELERWGKVNQSVRYVNNSKILSVSNVFHFQLSVLSIWDEDVFFSLLFYIEFIFGFEFDSASPTHAQTQMQKCGKKIKLHIRRQIVI